MAASPLENMVQEGEEAPQGVQSSRWEEGEFKDAKEATHPPTAEQVREAHMIRNYSPKEKPQKGFISIYVDSSPLCQSGFDGDKAGWETVRRELR